MREVTTTVKVYKFEELEDSVKKKVLNNMRDFNVDHGSDWHWCEKELIGEDLKAIGLKMNNLYFSGFSSQGDGACLEVTLEDLDLFLKHMLANGFTLKQVATAKRGEMGFNTKQRGHYQHSGCMVINFDRPSNLSQDSHYKIFEELESQVKELIQNLSDDAYRKLEKCHDWLTSDEQIIESIEANEYEFTSEGKLI